MPGRRPQEELLQASCWQGWSRKGGEEAVAVSFSQHYFFDRRRLGDGLVSIRSRHFHKCISPTFLYSLVWNFAISRTSRALGFLPMLASVEALVLKKIGDRSPQPSCSHILGSFLHRPSFFPSNEGIYRTSLRTLCIDGNSHTTVDARGRLDRSAHARTARRNDSH